MTCAAGRRARMRASVSSPSSRVIADADDVSNAPRPRFIVKSVMETSSLPCSSSSVTSKIAVSRVLLAR